VNFKNLGGGGGSSKTGIINTIVLLKFDGKEEKLVELDTLSTNLMVPWVIKFIKGTPEFFVGIGSCCRKFQIVNDK
jgi:hypothetical protein